jgi:hypothetical protein
MSEVVSFGRQASDMPDVSALIELERRAGKSAIFADLDDLLGDVLVQALTGKRIATIEHGRRADTVSINDLGQTSERIINDQFILANQRARGAWFIPENATLKIGLLNFPATFAAYPRFASGIVWDERASIDLTQSPTGIWIWSVLEPFFQQLYVPFELRGRLVGTKSCENQLASWTTHDDLASALRIDVSDELAVMRYAAGWGRLGSAEQLLAKQRLITALAVRATSEFSSLYRGYRLQPLIARYYQKAKDGRARRKQVLTRALERTLTGFFGGDWLSLLNYLGEQPHPDEEIVTAIPETKLFVGGTKTPAAVAGEKGIPAEEVERILATYWGTDFVRSADATSPVEERVRALAAFWHHFDEVHARQAPGMPSLRELVELYRAPYLGREHPQEGQPPLYLHILPEALIENIEWLWGSVMLPRWPERIVSEISPYYLMADAFGTALEFWHESALTAWDITEGSYSPTDLANLPDYYGRVISALRRLGCPIDPALFTELREAETRLGPPVPIVDKSSTIAPAEGITVEMTMSSGYRRSGFEELRDIMTRHRRAWASQYLTTYLRERWEVEIREAARLHAQAVAQRGTPPTAKQFARHAAIPVNHWLGGDMAAIYSALGEKSPVHPRRVALMPSDRRGFALTVFDRLGGRTFEHRRFSGDHRHLAAEAAEWDRQRKLSWLAEQSLRLIQLEEAIGHTPELKQFGAPSFESNSTVLADDPLEAWQQYVSAVRAARADYSAISTTRPANPVPPIPPHDQAPQLTAPARPGPSRTQREHQSVFARFRGKRKSDDPLGDDRLGPMRNGTEITLLEGNQELEVVGESYYQENLRRLVGPRRHEERVYYDTQAVLVPEDDNPYDANAVSVWVQGLKVGHLSRANARHYRPGLIKLQERYGHPIALNGVIVGSGMRQDGPGRLGIFLRHNPADFGL